MLAEIHQLQRKGRVLHESMEAPPLERKLVAILAADVEGYTRLMHQDEEAALATLSAHRSLVDRLISNWRGRVAGTAGDSVLAEFASVVDAFQCSVAIQQSLAQANAILPPDQQMQFRIGLNVGDVMLKEGDIFGDGVNVAARVESLAPPGGICVTRGVRDQMRDRVDADFEDLGERSVKNISRPIRVFRVKFDPDATPLEKPVDPSLQSGSVATEEPDGSHQRVEVDLAFWESIKDSDNIAMFEAYLEKFPEGEFRSLAEIRLAHLAKG
jgi:adenylate cyclase